MRRARTAASEMMQHNVPMMEMYDMRCVVMQCVKIQGQPGVCREDT